uniref:hypothetical protein n=1 Tax=Demequina pelophila TaxID=1638984 RepID=UPI000A3E25EA
GACLIGGVVALFNGRWVDMIVALVVAMRAGFIGNWAVKAQEGISESGRETLPDIDRAIDWLHAGEFQSANVAARGAATRSVLVATRGCWP